LAVAFFLLAQSMVRHRFHEGGRIDRHHTPQTIAGTKKDLVRNLGFKNKFPPVLRPLAQIARPTR
jgi:hypothetical protein